MLIIVIILLIVTLYLLTAYLKAREVGNEARRALELSGILHRVAIKILVRNLGTKVSVGLYTGVIENDYPLDGGEILNEIAQELGLPKLSRTDTNDRLKSYSMLCAELEKDWRKYELRE